MNLITSQHYLNEETVAEKVDAGDFAVQVSPEFMVDGIAYRVILDGHHSYAAALEAGVDPEIEEMTASEDDRVALIGNPEEFLAVCWMDGEYVFAGTERSVW